MEAAALPVEKNKKGATLCSMVYSNGLRYFSGYLIHKLVAQHRKLGTTLNDCVVCKKIIADPDVVFHLFISFKQYSENTPKNRGLKFCSRGFANVIDSYETVFLNMYQNYKHETNFTKLVIKVIKEKCKHPNLCCASLNEYLVRFFVTVRTYHNVRRANRNAAIMNFQSKLFKLNYSISKRVNPRRK